MIKELHYRRLNNPRIRVKIKTAGTIPKSGNNFGNNQDRLQVLTRTDSNEQPAKRDTAEDVKEDKHSNSSNEDMNTGNTSISENDLDKELSPKNSSFQVKEKMVNVSNANLIDNDLPRMKFTEIAVSTNSSHDTTRKQRKSSKDTSAQNTSISTSDVKAIEKSPSNNIKQISDDIIHRFQFYYLPKRNEYVSFDVAAGERRPYCKC